jgi:hypothetical protein
MPYTDPIPGQHFGTIEEHLRAIMDSDSCYHMDHESVPFAIEEAIAHAEAALKLLKGEAVPYTEPVPAQWYNEDMRGLVGHRVMGIFVSRDEEEMIFVTNTGALRYRTYGDCCSTTWFADIVGIKQLIGHTVTKAEEINVPIPEGDVRERSEEDQNYGIRLTTDGGVCDIVYRNASNGYYGGSIDLVKELPTSLDNYRPIYEDWSA